MKQDSEELPGPGFVGPVAICVAGEQGKEAGGHNKTMIL